ncbi:MAG: hypothetical protein HOM14_03270 [Gammaproteobacteria bacterium]|nr:hypothetical protein [Gammaproteobacteria bacterium]MBT3722475.1 hypothetical protein [Gammaproteobacteria bacterium]MBT4075353.1 hypothetical protein [Gammaproteobacteria bacterium]MBT4196965.1 hypothetical protein [Gammaproteobacteria bacterium]MBT4451821.1 hypothetical protein [Gammaproteobacteria bacterium]
MFLSKIKTKLDDIIVDVVEVPAVIQVMVMGFGLALALKSITFPEMMTN